MPLWSATYLFSPMHLGCLCFVYPPSLEQTKLSLQVAKYVLPGYSNDYKGFISYDLVAWRICISRNVIFCWAYSLLLSSVRFSPHTGFFPSNFSTQSPLPIIKRVYVRHWKPLPTIEPTSDHSQSPDLLPSSSGNTSPAPQILRHSTDISIIPDHCGFHTLFTTLSYASIPSFTGNARTLLVECHDITTTCSQSQLHLGTYSATGV